MMPPTSTQFTLDLGQLNKRCTKSSRSRNQKRTLRRSMPSALQPMRHPRTKSNEASSKLAIHFSEVMPKLTYYQGLGHPRACFWGYLRHRHHWCRPPGGYCPSEENRSRCRQPAPSSRWTWPSSASDEQNPAGAEIKSARSVVRCQARCCPCSIQEEARPGGFIGAGYL
jgi:hypothetical protein